MYEILASNTGQSIEAIERDCDRNKWLSAEEAVKYGCVDQVLLRLPEAPPKKPEDQD
jgi:ATP-dependent Clp protease protease subunit